MKQGMLTLLILFFTVLMPPNGVQFVCSAAEKATPRNSSGQDTSVPGDQLTAGHKHSGKDFLGMLDESQIPATVSRESVIKKLLAGKAEYEHNHDKAYVGSADLEALKKRVAALETGLIAYNAKLEEKIAIQEAEVSRLVKLLEDISRSGPDLVFKGINVQIVNGTGSTDGKVNGRGNLIIGYNETRGQDGQDVRVGSHNIVVGNKHNYSSFGGLMVGAFHTVSAPYSSVSGGYGNTAEGSYSTVSGGQLNKASGKYATVTGGMTRSAPDNNNWQGGKFSSER